MMFRRCVGALLVAVAVLISLGSSEANAFGARRGYYAPGYGGMYYPEYYPYYNPYVAPLPAFGILPQPLATMNMLYGYDSQGYGAQRTENYGIVRDPSDPPARKRSALYPAVPFEKSPAERLTDLRRVRFEITVPFANAAVLFDGVKTKQTGLAREFVTPPMQEDKEYSVTIVVQWTEQDGTVRTRQKTFTVVAGESVQHTFIE